MCIRPKTININTENASRPSRSLSVLRAARSDSFYKSILPTQYRQIVVPCGTCIECLKKRQADISSRISREAYMRGSFIFCTLTYDNEHLPLSARVMSVDTDSGEMKYFSEYFLLDPKSDLYSVAKERLLAKKANFAPRYTYVELAESPLDESSDAYYYQVTPSLNRRDLRLCIKRFRVRYKRKFGVALPSFSYVAVGEMGPKTCRPHYHICFMGLSEEQVRFFMDCWNLGRIKNIKVVNAKNKDGTDGFSICARYVGKYITKGRFECESVKCRSAEKPRLIASLGVGFNKRDVEMSGKVKTVYYLPKRLVNFYRCYDLFGQYDILTGRKVDGSYLTEPQLKVIAREVRKRNFLDVGSSRFSLPSVFIKKIWYVKDSQGALYSSPIRHALSAITSYDVLHHIVENVIKARNLFSPGQIEDGIREFVYSEKILSEAKDKFDESSLVSFYNKSIF